MKTTNARPQTTIEDNWQERALRAEALLEETKKEIAYLKAQVRLLTAKRFGASRERTPENTSQLTLFADAFNEAEASAEPFSPEPDLTQVKGYQRKRRKGQRDELLQGLPENVIEYRLSEEEMVCPSCGHARHIMGQEVHRELRIVPAQFWVDVHVQYVYSCRHCEQHSDSHESCVVTAPRPKRAIPNSVASPSVVAYIMEQKFVMGSPLYRQEQEWERRGIHLTRQTMSNWLLYCAEHWLDPIYQRMKAHLLKRDIIQADETTLKVLNEAGKAAESKSYMWLYRSGREGPGIVLYEYQPDRRGCRPQEFLRGFQGFLQTDGYAGYNQVENVIRVGCWSHARREFDEAIKASGTKGRHSKAREGMEFCNKLFRLEREWQDLSPADRYEQRLIHSQPVLEDFLAWLHATREDVLEKSHLGQAITYCLNQWEPLTAFLRDGRLEIDNNRSERSIKPFVIARKNFLFCITPKGAQASAVIFSIIETAKENGLKPFEYLEWLLSQLPNATSNDLDQYLPWSDALPDHCRSPKTR